MSVSCRTQTSRADEKDTHRALEAESERADGDVILVIVCRFRHW